MTESKSSPPSHSSRISIACHVEARTCNHRARRVTRLFWDEFADLSAEDAALHDAVQVRMRRRRRPAHVAHIPHLPRGRTLLLLLLLCLSSRYYRCCGAPSSPRALPTSSGRGTPAPTDLGRGARGYRARAGQWSRRWSACGTPARPPATRGACCNDACRELMAGGDLVRGPISSHRPVPARSATRAAAAFARGGGASVSCTKVDQRSSARWRA